METISDLHKQLNELDDQICKINQRIELLTKRIAYFEKQNTTETTETTRDFVEIVLINSINERDDLEYYVMVLLERKTKLEEQILGIKTNTKPTGNAGAVASITVIVIAFIVGMLMLAICI